MITSILHAHFDTPTKHEQTQAYLMGVFAGFIASPLLGLASRLLFGWLFRTGRRAGLMNALGWGSFVAITLFVSIDLFFPILDSARPILYLWLAAGIVIVAIVMGTLSTIQIGSATKRGSMITGYLIGAPLLYFIGMNRIETFGGNNFELRFAHMLFLAAIAFVVRLSFATHSGIHDKFDRLSESMVMNTAGVVFTIMVPVLSLFLYGVW